MQPTIYRVRFHLSIADGMAVEDANGAYVHYDDFKETAQELFQARQAIEEATLHCADVGRTCQSLTEVLAEAVRLIQMATQRYPHGLTPSQCRDAHAWLTKRA